MATTHQTSSSHRISLTLCYQRNRIDTGYEADVDIPIVADPDSNEPDGNALPQPKKKRNYHFRQRNLLRLFEEETDAGILKLFRMSRSQIKILFELVRDSLPQGNSRNGKSIKPFERLLTYLYYLGSNLQYYHSGVSHGLSEGAVCESIHMVNQIVFDEVVPKYICVPTQEEAKMEAELFSQKSGFPPIVWASLDGTHVEIRAPIDDHTEMYRNRDVIYELLLVSTTKICQVNADICNKVTERF